MTADEVEFLSGGGGGSQAPTDDDAPPAPGGSADPVDPQSGMTVVDPEEQPF